MKALVIWLIIFTYSCSAPDLSLSGEAGCSTTASYGHDDCAAGDGLFGRTECSVPLGPPWNESGCHSPSGSNPSTVWCCTSK